MPRFQFSVAVFGSPTLRQVFDVAHDEITVCSSRALAERVRFIEAEFECDDVQPGWEEWIVTVEGRAADRRALGAL